jgi:hypothetical protein
MKNLLRHSYLSILVIAILSMAGCEKKDDENGPDKKALLTAHIWKFESLTTTSTDTQVQLAVNLMAAFMTNATLNISADGTYTMTILGESDSGIWELNEDGTKLTIDKGTEDESVQTIVTLTSDVLEFLETVTDEDYGTFDVKYKWVK